MLQETRTAWPQAWTGGDPEDPALSLAAATIARGLRRPSLAPGTLGLIAALLDLVTVTLAFWFAAFVAAPAGGAGARTAGALAGGLAVVGLLRLAGGYRLDALRRFFRGLGTLVAAGLLVVAAARLADAAQVPALAAVVALAGFGAPARALASAVSAWALDFGLTERRAVIVGGGEEAAQLIAGLAANPRTDIRVCGIFDDRDDLRSPPVVTGIPKLGSTQSLLTFARTAEIDMLIVALPLSAERRIRELLRPLEVLPIDVRLSVYSADMEFRRRASQPRAEARLVDLMTRPLRSGDRLAKRVLDLVGASVTLVLLAPLMALVALAIRIESPGGVFFRQARHGYNHRSIDVWKFRSMYAEDCDAEARRIVTRDDPRVTRVGRVIRKFSIDELPQLFNVLRGDLSLVGPRPHAVRAVSSGQEAFAAIVDGYAARHKVRPGVTGWAQVHGWRGEIDDPEKLRRRFEHDLYYIENWSIWLDLRVLAMTPFRLLDTRSAY